MSTLEYYERFYYEYQVEGRGIVDVDTATKVFHQRILSYDELLSGAMPAVGNALDLGCGYGNFLFYLRAKGWKNATGVDLDEKQVHLAMALGLSASVGNALEAVREARDLSLVAAFDLLEHLSKNDAVRLLLDAHSALKPGGALIIQCPCTDGFTGAHDWGNDLTHRWAPSSNALGQMLKAAGFNKVILVDTTLPRYPMTWRSSIKRAARTAARAVAKPFLKLLGVSIPQIWSNSQIAIAYRA